LVYEEGEAATCHLLVSKGGSNLATKFYQIKALNQKSELVDKDSD